jgi:Cdc6-like AAA superfamily ATPase
MDVEPRIKSSLGIDEIEFKPYSLDEMKKSLMKSTPIFVELIV